MTDRVVLATRNAGKVAELRRILRDSGSGVTLLELGDLPGYEEPVETGETFVQNALLKARACVAATGLAAVADDSGLSVNALNGMPGVLSARWAGRRADDTANLQLVLDQLADFPDGRRGAEFVCAAAWAAPASPGAAGEAPRTEVTEVTEARWHGSLLRAPRGTNGFGYDPIFVPAGGSRTAAELSATEKAAASHRGQAFRLLVAVLGAHLR